MSTQPGGLLPGLEPQGPDTKRLLVTVTLVTAMWMGFQFLLPAPPVNTTAPPAATTTAPQPAGPSHAAAIGVPTADDALPEEKRVVTVDVASAIKAARPEELVAVNGGYRAEVTSKGAQISAFQLDGYNNTRSADAVRKGLEPAHIDLSAAEERGARLFALQSRGGDVQLAADAAYRVVSSDDKAVVFERTTPSGVVITRTYAFDADRFGFTHELVLKNTSDGKKTALLDVVLTGQERSGERDEGGLFAATPDALAGACRVHESREHFTSKEIEDEPKRFAGNVDYAALDRHYFLAAVVFDAVPTERCVVQPFKQGDAYGMQIHVEQAPVDLAPGEVKSFKHKAYFGPKQVGLLESFGHDLGENIDFGWFGVISRPMLWVLVKLYGYTGNFGIAIILLTLLMKILTFPLTQKSYVSMQQVRKLKPDIDALQKKYGADRTTLGQKQMELYKERGINPLAGCFPVLIQMPIWFALYRTLSQAVELYQQPFFGGITNLTQPDMLLPFGISFLPLIVGALMLGQTFLQPPPDDQPQMKYMMWFMPFMFTFLMLSMASGLSIYMITNSILTMAQQIYIKKKYA
jgi:YidC/Oxa1 family membrane protein insertase